MLYVHLLNEHWVEIDSFISSSLGPRLESEIPGSATIYFVQY